MIGAEQDVPDAFDDVGTHHLPPRLRGGDLDPRLRWASDGLKRPPVEQFDANKRVGDRELKPGELDAFAGEPVRPGIDPPPLQERIGKLLDHRLLHVPDAVGHLQHQRQAHAREHRSAPEHRELAGRRLLDLQVRRARLVGMRRGQKERRRKHHGRGEAPEGGR